jgi:beta-carotene ketolase (CrtO type)
MPEHDAVVVGGGHNGLACACYLARAGLSVLVLERYRDIGGMTLTEEVTLPGFRSDVHASGYQLANLSPAPHELGLFDRGVELIEPEFPWAHAFPDGRGIAIHRELDRSAHAIAQYAPVDADAWRRLFGSYLQGKEELVQALFSPPGSFTTEASALTTAPGGMDRYRFSLQSMRSWCNENFESEEIRTVFGAFAAFVGCAPDDAGGAEIAWMFASVLQDTGNNLVKGGMHHVSLAMADDLRDHGGQIETGVDVDRILVEEGRATAVRLTGGETRVASRVVVSAVDPPQLVQRLLGEETVGSDVAADMRRYELGEATFAIYVALDGLVEYKAGPDAGRAAHVHLTPPSLDAFATASVDARAGRIPATPLIVSWNDSVVDPSRVPPGKHLKKFVVLGVPYDIRGDATGRVAGRTWDEAREPYADYLMDMIDRDYLPGINARVLRRTAHSPVDLERKLTTAVRGTIGHGAMVPYQMGFMRPIPELAHYRSPVENVYLCASGNHPGPGVSMGPGRNAATVICADLGLAFPSR